MGIDGWVYTLIKVVGAAAAAYFTWLLWHLQRKDRIEHEDDHEEAWKHAGEPTQQSRRRLRPYFDRIRRKLWLRRR